MRVVAGTAKGHHLKAPSGIETRPTSDKVRGAIFNVLGDYFVDGTVLDLFAGTGALGIEALSRGAEHAIFVERWAPAVHAIRANLRHTKLEEHARVLTMSVERALSTLDAVADVVLLDPPYAYPDLDGIMARLSASRVLGNDTMVVFEHSPRFVVAKRYGRLALQRQKVYGDTTISWYVVQEDMNA